MVKILIVDDAAFIRQTLKQFVSSISDIEGFGEANNGLEALRQYTLISPDIVIMDIVMPEMDGITAIKEIVKIDPAAKVIMCSATNKKTNVFEAIRYGAKDFLAKPIEKERVIASIQNVLRLSQK